MSGLLPRRSVPARHAISQSSGRLCNRSSSLWHCAHYAVNIPFTYVNSDAGRMYLSIFGLGFRQSRIQVGKEHAGLLGSRCSRLRPCRPEQLGATLQPRLNDQIDGVGAFGLSLDVCPNLEELQQWQSQGDATHFACVCLQLRKSLSQAASR